MLDQDDNIQSISVVMVSYHTGDVLWRSIDSVLKAEGLKELIIVDNGNPEEITHEIKQLSEKDQRVSLLTGHGNIGFAAANNLGASHTTGNYIVFLNPDCIIPDYTFNEGMNALEADTDNFMVGARITNLDGSEQAGSRRNLLTPTVAIVEGLYLHNFLPKSILPRIHCHDIKQSKPFSEVPAISGAFMMLRKETFDKVGGMDEGYFLHVEDLDFCLQINKLGGKIIHLSHV
ncbi:MAG: glycosyltransferase family 2 protein, partial [Rickettsiales bacterium]|nr:glycosyltransferase family 2 protein [Rickettsiales bacterium]